MEWLCLVRCLPRQPSCHPPLPLAVIITIPSAAAIDGHIFPSSHCTASQPCTLAWTFAMSTSHHHPLPCLLSALSPLLQCLPTLHLHVDVCRVWCGPVDATLLPALCGESAWPGQHQVPHVSHTWSHLIKTQCQFCTHIHT